MPATTYTVLKNFITAKVTALSGSGQPIGEVSDNAELNFDSYPAAIIVPAQGESDWETNAEDKRTYAFDLILYEESKKGGVSQALDNLMDAVDQVLDAFAVDKTFTGISMPTGKILLNIEPVAAGWGNIPDKELLAATVKIQCHVSVSNE